MNGPMQGLKNGLGGRNACSLDDNQGYQACKHHCKGADNVQRPVSRHHRLDTAAEAAAVRSCLAALMQLAP
jgi:hypothetical protein